MRLTKLTRVREKIELKSERQSRGGEENKKENRMTIDHSKAGTGGWLKINDLHQGRKEEGRGEGEKEGGTLKPT